MGRNPAYNPEYPSFRAIDSSVENVPPPVFGIVDTDDDNDRRSDVASIGNTQSIRPAYIM